MLTRAALVALAVLAAGCSTRVVETGPGATAGQGFREIVVTVPPTTAPSSDTTTAPGTTAAGSTGSLDFQAGDCITWEQGESSVQFTVVDCAEEHLAEVAGAGDLSGAFAAGAAFPDQDSLSQAVSEVCSPIVVAFLGRELREGEEPGVIPPTEQGWAEGERVAWCTVGLARVEGSRPPYTGRLTDRAAG